MFFLRPVKVHWVINKQLLARCLVWCDLCDELYQETIVRHVVFEVGVRPVGAPQDAVRELRNEALGKRHDIEVGRGCAVQCLGSCHRQAFWAGHLAPDVRVFSHKALEQREFRAIHWLRDVWAAHVVDHDGGGQGGEKVPQLG